MNPMTGGCHYDGGCGGFEQKCGHCPKLRAPGDNDISRQIWVRKAAALHPIGNASFHIVSPSRWLAGCVSRSSLFSRFSCSVIPNSIDTNLYRPVAKAAARSELGIDQKVQMVLFVSGLLDDPRKGFKFVEAALSRLRMDRRVFFSCVGGSGDESLAECCSRAFGEVSDEQLMTMIYAASDVVVVPSTEDNFPNTILEACACGTPVVVNDVGGMPEMVQPGVNGEVVDCSDAEAFAGAVRRVASDSSTLSISCRELVVQNYSPAIQAERYLKLYREMLYGGTSGQ